MAGSSRSASSPTAFQLKLFEHDAEKMFEWIGQHVDLFLATYARIGESAVEAADAHREHEEFARAAMNTHVNINHIMTVAQRLLDTGHYAAPRIHAVTQRLDDNWQMFSRALQMRENVLALSVNFHARADEVGFMGRDSNLL